MSYSMASPKLIVVDQWYKLIVHIHGQLVFVLYLNDINSMLTRHVTKLC